MEIDNNSFKYINESPKTQVTKDSQNQNLSTNETLENGFHVENNLSDSIDNIPKEEMESLLFIADTNDVIKAIEKNETLDYEEKLPENDVVLASFDNLSISADSLEKFEIAIKTIEYSMKDNPENANSIKQGVIDLLKEKILDF